MVRGVRGRGSEEKEQMGMMVVVSRWEGREDLYVEVGGGGDREGKGRKKKIIGNGNNHGAMEKRVNSYVGKE